MSLSASLTPDHRVHGGPAAASVALASFVRPDPRADGGHRSIALEPDRVTIDRAVRGVAMRVAVPASAYRGVCIGLEPDGFGDARFIVSLVHPDAELSVVLADTASEDAGWAAWRAWARYFGLSALVTRNDGPEPRPLAFVARAAVASKRRVRRVRRRPGVVVRRLVRPEALSTIHRERELIARH